MPTEKRIQVSDIQMNYYEQGEGEPILFLHGIPTNSYLWRNIIPQVSVKGRAIAVDLAGYGKSDVPLDNDYSIASQYSYLKGFIDALQLKNIMLVVNDLGSLLGLKYAVENPDNVKGIVLIEAAFMPTEEWYKQLTAMQKMMFWMMQNKKLAEKMIVDMNIIPGMMMKMATNKKLSTTEKQSYTEPYKNDIERRKVILYGPGPATFPPKGKTLQRGDFADELDKISSGLKIMSGQKPYLLLYASPGMITRKKAVQYAVDNFKNLTPVYIGKGKHFLPEDQPLAISKAIVDWLP